MTEEEAKIWHCHERRSFQDELRHKRTRQARFESTWLRLGHSLSGAERLLEPSDGGAGAEAVRDVTGFGEPLWLRLWGYTYAEMPRTGKAVLMALGEDWRTAVAARKAGVSRPTVDAWKRNFKILFAQCYKAYLHETRG